MRSLVCAGILLAIGSAFLTLHELVSSPITSMFRLAVGAMLIAVLLAFLILRWVETRRFGLIGATGFAGLSVFVFFATWIVLWFVSEQCLIDHYLRIRGGGDTGYNYFYLGASGMGYAEGLSKPDKIFTRVIQVGGIGALLLCVPFGAILTAFKGQSEPDQTTPISGLLGTGTCKNITVEIDEELDGSHYELSTTVSSEFVPTHFRLRLESLGQVADILNFVSDAMGRDGHAALSLDLVGGGVLTVSKDCEENDRLYLKIHAPGLSFEQALGGLSGASFLKALLPALKEAQDAKTEKE